MAQILGIPLPVSIQNMTRTRLHAAVSNLKLKSRGLEVPSNVNCSVTSMWQIEAFPVHRNSCIKRPGSLIIMYNYSCLKIITE